MRENQVRSMARFSQAADLKNASDEYKQSIELALKTIYSSNLEDALDEFMGYNRCMAWVTAKSQLRLLPHSGSGE
ncbi:10708_t:CDS:2 [Paraglomus brasilianum]|uniref:10708_t:CDS:1 n=1 Tax=Paraglomus brasilianum TaxID=144538 RepID=A0A9N8Z0C3_9GLOM|nr:10708_t:CDS:2 [Paraglomus brasilianum]